MAAAKIPALAEVVALTQELDQLPTHVKTENTVLIQDKLKTVMWNLGLTLKETSWESQKAIWDDTIDDAAHITIKNNMDIAASALYRLELVQEKLEAQIAEKRATTESTAANQKIDMMKRTDALKTAADLTETKEVMERAALLEKITKQGGAFMHTSLPEAYTSDHHSGFGNTLDQKRTEKMFGIQETQKPMATPSDLLTKPWQWPMAAWQKYS